MEIRLLGPFEIVDEGAVAPLPRLPRTMLAALVLRANQVVPADALAEAIWEGEAPETAASVLRSYVTAARRALPAARLVTLPSGYQLVVEPGEIDATRFEGLLADGRRALAGGHARLARALCQRGLALWRGPALLDLSSHRFARDEGARLDELRLACLETRLDAELRLGRHADALSELEGLVAEHPLRERLRALLVLALYRSGRQADALACHADGRRVLVEEVGLEPGPELRDLQARILAHDPSLAPPAQAAAPPSVPAPPTATIGRGAALAAVRAELLDRGGRLVTLVGPGGIGKTRLAVEAARSIGPELADGAVFVDASTLTAPDQLLPAVARTLGLREAASWFDLLVENLRGRELLLVLDNLEHLVDGVAPLSALLDGAPRIALLVTSRRPLRLAAERVVEVPPLDHRAAVELLAARAASVGADPHGDGLEAVCERLDGLPLAIELTAPWLRTLPPAELLERLERRLEVMRRGRRDAPERHRTMRAAIGWSVELLDPGERNLLGALALFSGGFATDAALAVGDGATVEQLDALVDATVVHSRGGRHWLLEVVREYASELPAADEEARARHARHYADLAERAEPQLTGGEQGLWFERLELEHDNLRAALDWAGRADPPLELRLAAALGRFWYVRGYLGEGLSRLRAAAGRSPDAPAAVRARALRAASALALLQGDYVLARSLVEEALHVARASDDLRETIHGLSNLGAILHAQGELDEAAAALDECIADAERLGTARLVALASNNRGDVALTQGDLGTAAARFEQSLAILRAENDVANVARALFNLGAVAVQQGRHDDARAQLAESLELAVAVDDSEDVAWCLIALAAVAEASGRRREAALMVGFAEALLERIGASTKPFERGLLARTRARLEDAMEPAALAEALWEGSHLPTASAVRLGASGDGQGAL